MTKIKENKLKTVRLTGVPQKHGKETLTYTIRHPHYHDTDVTDTRTITQKDCFGKDENITKALFIDKWLDWAEQGYPMLVDYDADRVRTFMKWIVKSRGRKFDKLAKADLKKVA
tara:strand:+ start:715 stop:1056 length:342 start_codon:yes stop_codon:yes gene_type:complete